MRRPLSQTRLTPYDAEYGTCARTYAEFSVDCALIDPETVTDRLLLTPSKVSKKGAIVKTDTGQRTQKKNIWFLSSQKNVSSRDLRHHLDWLLEKLTLARDSILRLQAEEGLIMRVNCVWESSVGHGGPALWPEQMRGLAELNLELDFDFYFFPED